jgi:hypothetical protein
MSIGSPCASRARSAGSASGAAVSAARGPQTRARRLRTGRIEPARRRDNIRVWPGGNGTLRVAAQRLRMGKRSRAPGPALPERLIRLSRYRSRGARRRNRECDRSEECRIRRKGEAIRASSARVDVARSVRLHDGAVECSLWRTRVSRDPGVEPMRSCGAGIPAQSNASSERDTPATNKPSPRR